ncbi:hypothetical protein CDAR_32911 [Caerostris darwini]|uniref:Uncharacterized protein n=1 Tax=Caerostris darwini TaxID=1538125 RepID=A0AAV4SLU1_9ARAC|nr:hypothetical protein CDAR_32911 [Caerostris darwini]
MHAGRDVSTNPSLETASQRYCWNGEILEDLFLVLATFPTPGYGYLPFLSLLFFTCQFPFIKWSVKKDRVVVREHCSKGNLSLCSIYNVFVLLVLSHPENIK